MVGSDDGLFVFYTGSEEIDPVTDMTVRRESYTHTVNALFRATIPESTAHMYQLDIYVNDLARNKGRTGTALAPDFVRGQM